MKQKTKNILLVCGFVLVTVIAYNYSISNTLELRKEYLSLKKGTEAFQNIPLKLSALKQKEKYYDSLLAKYQLGEGSLQNNMLKTINTYAEKSNIKIIGFEEPHRISQNGLNANTYQFTLEGEYNAIITLIHQLEQQTKFGEIINLNFKKEKNHRSGRFYLQAIVLLKSFG